MCDVFLASMCDVFQKVLRAHITSNLVLESTKRLISKERLLFPFF